MINITVLIRDYRMMKREIERLQKIVYGAPMPMLSWGVAQYGIEATLPKGSKGKSQAELRDMDIREQKQIERLKEYERKVFAIESAADFLDREILKICYDLINESLYCFSLNLFSCFFVRLCLANLNLATTQPHSHGTFSTTYFFCFSLFFS